MNDLILYTRHHYNGDLMQLQDNLIKKQVVCRKVSSFAATIDEIDREKPDAILFHFEPHTRADFTKIKQSLMNHGLTLPIIGFGQKWVNPDPHCADDYLEVPFTIEQLCEVLRCKTFVKF